jgi:hypothetical protein
MKLHQLKPLKKRKRKKVGIKAQKICRIKKKEALKRNLSLLRKIKEEGKVKNRLIDKN